MSIVGCVGSRLLGVCGLCGGGGGSSSPFNQGRLLGRGGGL